MKVSYTLFTLTHWFICRSVSALPSWICDEAAAQKEENYEKESRKFTRSYGSRSYCSGRMRIQ